MAKNDNPQVLRLYESIVKHSDKEKADEIINKVPLSKSANVEKKFLWAENICKELSRTFTEETVRTIRMDCACGPQSGKIEKLKKLYESSKDIAEFADKATKLNQGYTIKYEDDSLYLIYPECYCSCVKQSEKHLPKTWCYCTLGYTKRMFDNVLDKQIEVELIESVKLGGDKCVIKVFGF